MSLSSRKRARVGTRTSPHVPGGCRQLGCAAGQKFFANFCKILQIFAKIFYKNFCKKIFYKNFCKNLQKFLRKILRRYRKILLRGFFWDPENFSVEKFSGIPENFLKKIFWVPKFSSKISEEFSPQRGEN